MVKDNHSCNYSNKSNIRTRLKNEDLAYFACPASLVQPGNVHVSIFSSVAKRAFNSQNTAFKVTYLFLGNIQTKLGSFAVTDPPRFVAKSISLPLDYHLISA